ncbi:hypothetical protein [Methylobacterium sp. WL120]|uniref:hypothetical protein n=1 Tax=Methylobacterium sp. WL120 TaxID=2603887 RepID=UPI0011C88539|nr:hypothetical protein [Methylobacterium sp. WL120]TXM63648.1 hypothetical protein FV229_21650 [Methylobacterium sp. WL120]
MKRTIRVLPENRNHAVVQSDGDHFATDTIVHPTLIALLDGLPSLDREGDIEPVDRSEPDPVDL